LPLDALALEGFPLVERPVADFVEVLLPAALGAPRDEALLAERLEPVDRLVDAVLRAELVFDSRFDSREDESAFEADPAPPFLAVPADLALEAPAVFDLAASLPAPPVLAGVRV
jgi:hypothetical protein